MDTETPNQTRINFRNLGTGQLKEIKVPADQAYEAIEMIRKSDTLEYCSAYPVED